VETLYKNTHALTHWDRWRETIQDHNEINRVHNIYCGV